MKDSSGVRSTPLEARSSRASSKRKAAKPANNFLTKSARTPVRSQAKPSKVQVDEEEEEEEEEEEDEEEEQEDDDETQLDSDEDHPMPPPPKSIKEQRREKSRSYQGYVPSFSHQNLRFA